MDSWLYVTQTIAISGALLLLVRRQSVLLGLQVVVWTVGVIGLFLRFGISEQLNFYSNDQQIYTLALQILTNERWPTEASWWLSTAKIPYTVAALPLSLLGIHESLALKTVSLVCFLALSQSLINRSADARLSRQVRVLFLTGCGLIGTMYSMLALRETMMMYLVYRFATDRSPASRIFSAILLYLLRPHLAAAVVSAELALGVWHWFTEKRRLGYMEIPALLAIGLVIGDLLYSQGFQSRFGRAAVEEWGIAEATRIASNFVGLQFLTNDEGDLRMSVMQLLLLRFVLSETVLIPAGFTFVCLFMGNRLLYRHRFTLLAFTIYASIATRTNFNSFRQNIPLMVLLGVTILDFLRERETPRTDYDINTSARQFT